ncbi:class I SAM-dependent methyltransferase [Evansella halocellulosilytica]|uniref:class I SAM-dependent methyltransferase n=1 Tax=Evansella halocellulosilytica TaxID=2011013 RepID=UPI000BB89D52|nr:class I SAM-dependent methyltransferase [Evansella halocellulosilytica]
MKQTKDTYDQLAKTYDEDVDTNSPFNSDYERPAMMNMIPEDLQGYSILDAGCSAGWYTEMLTERGAKVTGIDLSPKMIAAAKRRLKGRANVFCHDLSVKLPFNHNEFDFIISSLTLHYLKDWTFTFNEFNRILKPQGTFLFSTHHPFMDFTRFQCDDYFETSLLQDTWHKPSITINVSFYRRSLQKIIHDTNNYFQLEKLIEPQGHERMKKTAPNHYEYVMKNPHFLIIEAKSRKS